MRLRLLLSFILIVLVAILSMVLVVRLSAEREVRAWMFRGGMHGLDGLVGELEDYYRTHQTWEGVDSQFGPTGHGKGVGPGMMGRGMMNQRLRLADPQGNILVDTDDQASKSRIEKNELKDAIHLEVDGRLVGYLLPDGGISIDLLSESSLLSRLNRAALISALAAGTVALILALLLAYRLLGPVRDLTAAARTLAAGDLSQRVPTRGADELAELGKTFNSMAASLEKAEASRRDMTADIAHELRTPLAVQRAHLEALQDGVYPLNTENLEPILAQNHLLTRLVEDLRTLALADSGQLHLDKVPTDLPALARPALDGFRPQALARGITLDIDPPAPPSPPLLSVDPARIEQLLAILITNALQHTPEGGRIVLSFVYLTQRAAQRTPGQGSPPSPGGMQISVRDSGPGIPQDALSKVFERFYRADRSRSREEGGSGLGLAIARQIAEAHGGSLKAANHPEGGAIFTLTLGEGL